MRKMSAIACFFLLAPFICQAHNFGFDFTKTADWGWAGRCTDFTIKVTIPESSPIKVKFKATFNQTAVFRVMEAKMKSTNCSAFTGSAAPTLVHRGNNAVKDIASFDLGQVTVETGGKCEMEFLAKLQLLKHPSLVHGKTFWQSMGVEYINQSVWAAQQAFRSMTPENTRPYLDVTVEPVQSYTYDVISGPSVVYMVKVAHNCYKTSSEISSLELEISFPSTLAYQRFDKESTSSAVTQASSSAVYVKYTTGAFAFSDTVAFNMTFSYDSGNALADSKLHQVTMHVDVKYVGACCSRPFIQKDVPIPSFPFYTPVGSCDQEVDTPTFSASSYATDGLPSGATLFGESCWKPKPAYKKDRNQFLQLNFTNRVKILRLVTQGYTNNSTNIKCYVKGLKLYYSDNGATWKAYRLGSNDKIFKANKNAEKATIIPLQQHIEAKYLRINPQDMENEICLRVKVYGCSSTSPLPASVDIPGRSILFVSNTIYICNSWMTKKLADATCYYSTDGGNAWTEVDFRVKNIAFAGEDGKLYGNGNSGVYRGEGGTWNVITADEYTRLQGLATSTKAKRADHLGNYEGMPDTPQAADRMTQSGGTTVWGATGKGVHVSTDSGSTWKLKATWFCLDLVT